MSQTKRPKRVLVVAYLFPPVGGAGVQRAAKFVKYLPEHGWQVSVLTASNPSVPVVDESLLADIPSETIIRGARTLEPGYSLKNAVSASTGGGAKRKSVTSLLKSGIRRVGNFVLQPDAQILWRHDAVRQGLKLLEEVEHDAIMVTAPPFSSFLVGAALSKRTGLPLLLDYRDEWDISSKYWENKSKDPISGWIQSRMQQNVVRAANSLVATTRSSAESLREIARKAGSQATTHHIYNGYDQDDFKANAQNGAKANGGKFRVSYVGTLWNLTSVEPLVTAIEQLVSRAPELAQQLELTFAGRRTAAQEAFLDRLEPLPCTLNRMPYIDHDGAVELMKTSDVQCLLMSDVPHAGRVVPAKLFEYMASRRRILAITPEGEVSGLLKNCPLADVHVPSDVNGIAQTLTTLMDERHVDALPGLDIWDPTAFERKHLSGQLATLLDDISGCKTSEHKEAEKAVSSPKPVAVPVEAS